MMLNRALVKPIVLFTFTALCLIQITYCAGFFSPQPVLAYDDAYITLQNAKELAGQSTSLFDSESPLQGSTSIAHTSIVSLLLFVFSDLTAIIITCVLCSIVYALGILRLAQRFNLTVPYTLSFLFLGLYAGQTPLHLMNGLETPLVMAVSIWIVNLGLGSQRERFIVLPVLLGIAPFVRPEYTALSGIIGGYLLYQAMALQRRPLFSTLLQLGSLTLLGALPFLCLLYFETGSPLANTVSAKLYYFAESCIDLRSKYNLARHTLLNNVILQLGLTLCFAAGLLLFPLGRCFLLAIVVFLITYFLKLPGAFSHYHGRYAYIAVPFLIAGGMYLYQTEIRHRWAAKTGAKPFAAFASLVMASTLYHYTSSTKNVIMEQQNLTKYELNPVADWLTRHVPKNAKILLHDAGYLGYSLREVKLIDLVGLKTQSISQIHEDITLPSCGANRAAAISEIIHQFKPDYYVVLDEWNTYFHLTRTSDLRDIRLDMLRGEGMYKVYRVGVPLIATKP